MHMHKYSPNHTKKSNHILPPIAVALSYFSRSKNLWDHIFHILQICHVVHSYNQNITFMPLLPVIQAIPIVELSAQPNYHLYIVTQLNYHTFVFNLYSCIVPTTHNNVINLIVCTISLYKSICIHIFNFS